MPDRHRAVHELDDRAVAGGVRHRDMHRRGLARRTHGHVAPGDLHRIGAQVGHGLGHGCVTIQQVLRKDRQRDAGGHAVIGGIGRLDLPQQVHHQPGLVHPVGGSDVIARHGQAAIARRPGCGPLARRAVARHPAGKGP